MNDRQENKLSMAKAVKIILDNNATIVSSIVAFAAASTTLGNNIDAIDGITQLQVKKIKGKAIDKETAGDIAIKAAIELTGPTQAYAKATGNNDLFEEMNYFPSNLKKLRDTVLVSTLTLIRDTVQDNLANLADYGITAAMITALTNAISGYNSLVGTPRAAISDKSSATKALTVEFKKLDATLAQLDGLAEAKRNTEPDFYNSYKSARIIVDNIGSGGGDPKDGKTDKPTV